MSIEEPVRLGNQIPGAGWAGAHAIGLAAFVVAGTAFAASHLTRNYSASLPLGVYWLRTVLPVADDEDRRSRAHGLLDSPRGSLVRPA